MNKLDELAELQSKRDLLNLQLAEALALVMEPIKAQVDAAGAQFGPQLAETDAEIEALTAEIRADVLAHGETVKGTRLIATWNKGRTSWDTRKLDGYAAAHPEIAVFKTVGEPSVSIRVAGGK